MGNPFKGIKKFFKGIKKAIKSITSFVGDIFSFVVSPFGALDRRAKKNWGWLHDGLFSKVFKTRTLWNS